MLLDLKDPAAALPRKGRPRGTRRLKTSAETVQIATDRIEKVGRCGSCKNTGHNRRKCPKLLSNQLVASDDAGFRRDAEFEEMWSDVFSLNPLIEDGK
ncbi:hypothetical protein V1504DRAFT_462485 [Lipomyces starkeyi]